MHSSQKKSLDCQIVNTVSQVCTEILVTETEVGVSVHGFCPITAPFNHECPPLPGAEIGPTEQVKNLPLVECPPFFLQVCFFEIAPPGSTRNTTTLLPSVDSEDASVDAVPYQEGCLSEIGPELVSGVITVDDQTHTNERSSCTFWCSCSLA